MDTKLTLILLTWTIWRAPTNASKWRMGFNSAFKGLIGWKRDQCRRNSGFGVGGDDQVNKVIKLRVSGEKIAE